MERKKEGSLKIVTISYSINISAVRGRHVNNELLDTPLNSACTDINTGFSNTVVIMSVCYPLYIRAFIVYVNG
jgi:hypothetical protein